MSRSFGRRTRACTSTAIAVALSLPLLHNAPLVVHASGTPMISVYTTEVFGGTPTPWNGSGNVNYVGTTSPSDSAALRLDSPTALAITDVSLNVGGAVRDLWGSSLSIPANGSLILTETAAGNFELDDGNTTCQNAILSVNVVGYGVSTLSLSGAGTAALCSDTPQWQYAGQTGAPSVPGGSNSTPSSGPSGSETYGAANPGQSQQHRCFIGDPVNCATGNFTETASDLGIPGRGRSLLLTRTYNAQAAATEATPDALGWGWTHAYAMSISVDAGGNATVHQENGSTVTFAPSGSSYVAPAWVTASLVKNADGSYTYTLADGRADSFSRAGVLLSETDRNGYVTTLGYSGGALSSVTDAAGRSLSFGYDGSGRLTQVGDPGGRTVAYTYDAAGNLGTVTDANGGVTQFGYDAQHRLTTITDATGGVTTNVYDSSNRVTSQTDPMSRTTTFQYASGQTTITDPLGNVTSEGFSAGEVTSVTRGVGTPLAATWQYGYDSADDLTQVTDPNGSVWRATFDSHGNQLSATDPLSHTTAYAYDASNDLTSATDAMGVTTTYLYDAHGNLTASTRALTSTGQSVIRTYAHGDAAHPGDVTAITDPLLYTAHMTYDANGDIASATDPLGGLTTMAYDVLGRLTASVTPRGNAAGSSPAAFTTSYTYDNLGHVLTRTDPLGDVTSWQYDAAGRLTATTDADHRTTTTTYDHDGEVTAVKRGDGSVTHTGYDGGGNPLTQSDGLGHTTTYGYDALNRLVTVTDALGRRTLFSYDAGGRRKSALDALGRTTTYGYTAANQPASMTYSDGHTAGVSFQYDPDGRRIGMTDGSGTSAYGYDSLGRLVSQLDGFGQTIGYAYDLDGNLTTLLYPSAVVTANGVSVGVSAGSSDGHPAVARTYDALGHMSSVTDWLQHTTSFRYDPDGNQVGASYANGTVETRSYDNADRLSSIGDSGPAGQFVALPYSRDAAGDITAANPVGPASAVSASYTYDGVDHLSASGVPNPVTQALPDAYQYDAADHLTTLTTPATTTTRQYDAADELTSSALAAAQTTSTYDLDGNRVSTVAPAGVTTTYGYDQAGRLTSYAGPAQNAVNGQSGQNIVLSYAYNGDGLRTSKTTSGFQYDEAEGLPLILVDGTTAYVTGPGGLPLEQITAASTVLYYHHDAQGSTRAMTDQSARPVLTYTYNDWGRGTPSTTAVVNPFQYDGQYTDVETGVQYLRARYYDPSTGQFLSRDPLAALTGSAYGFSGDNPINGSDPSGLCFGPDWLCNAASAVVNGAGTAIGAVGNVLDTAGSAIASAGSAVGSAATTVFHDALDVAATAPYAVYYASYQAARGINWVGSKLGVPGSVISHIVALPFTIPEATGLALDAGIDWIKGHTVNNESVCDEGIRGGILPRFILGGGPKVYLPGIHADGSTDFQW